MISKQEAADAFDPISTANKTICGLARIDCRSNLLLLNQELEAHLAKIQSNDFTELEAMLLGQAHSLNSAGSHYLMRIQGVEQLAPNPDLLAAYSTLALRCFEQSRKAIHTLIEIRNPKRGTTFIKNQQNLLQLNKHKELEGRTDAAMDIGIEGTSTPVNTAVATVAALHRPKDFPGKGQGRPEPAKARASQR